MLAKGRQQSCGVRLMSALGHKRTFALQKGMSALPPKADMRAATKHVRYGSKADICSAQAHVCFGPIADIQSHPDELLKDGSFSCRCTFDYDIALATALNDNSAVV